MLGQEPEQQWGAAPENGSDIVGLVVLAWGGCTLRPYFMCRILTPFCAFWSFEEPSPVVLKKKFPFQKKATPPLALGGNLVPCTSFPGRGAGRRQRGMTGYVGRGRRQASTFCAHLCTTSLLFCISASEHGGCQPVTNQPLVSVAAQIKSATRKVEQSKHSTQQRESAV